MEQHEQVHCEQTKGHEGDFVFGLVLEWLQRPCQYTWHVLYIALSYLALEEEVYQLLHALRLPKQPLLDGEAFEAALAAAYVVDARVVILNGTVQQILAVGAYVVALGLDVREVVRGQAAVGVLGQVLERDLGLALADHEVHDDEALEDNGPGGVAEAVGQGAEDLSDAGLAGMRRDENVLDILGFGRRELECP